MAAHETPPSTSEFTTSSRTGAGSGGNGHGKEKIYVPSKATANDEQCTDNNIELWSFGGNCTEMTVASPNYPNWYPANANCNYNINAPENTKVSQSSSSVWSLLTIDRIDYPLNVIYPGIRDRETNY